MHTWGDVPARHARPPRAHVGRRRRRRRHRAPRPPAGRGAVGHAGRPGRRGLDRHARGHDLPPVAQPDVRRHRPAPAHRPRVDGVRLPPGAGARRARHRPGAPARPRGRSATTWSPYRRATRCRPATSWPCTGAPWPTPPPSGRARESPHPLGRSRNRARNTIGTEVFLAFHPLRALETCSRQEALHGRHPSTGRRRAAARPQGRRDRVRRRDGDRARGHVAGVLPGRGDRRDRRRRRRLRTRRAAGVVRADGADRHRVPLPQPGRRRTAAPRSAG